MTAEAAEAGMSLIRATVREAEVVADLIIAFLRGEQGALAPGAPLELPGGFLRELGAVLRLATWEAAGLRQSIDPTLPTAESAYLDLLERAIKAPETYDESDRPGSLAPRVLMASVRRLARDAPEGFAGDVVIDPHSDDAALDALAEFLFAHRRADVEPRL
jgi:hypothetical protein